MKSINVLTLKEAESYIRILRSFGYYLWREDYTWYSKEGYHALFRCEGEEDVEVVTRNQSAQMALIRFDEKKKETVLWWYDDEE